MSEALLDAMTELDQLRDKAKQLEDSNEWLQERVKLLTQDKDYYMGKYLVCLEDHALCKEALLGLMKLTAAAYGHQVDQVLEYVAARRAIGGE